MPSPYIKITERDDSAYTTTTSNTVVALVGFATKGPIDTPTFCTSIKQFKNTFGLTPSSQPYSHLAAYKYFDQGSSLWFTRIADTTADYAVTRGLSNNPALGVAAIMTSTNTITSASFVAATNYSTEITVEAAGIDYTDTITVNLSLPTNINELVNDINTAITGSTILTGLLTASATKANGSVDDVTPANNVYLTLTSTTLGPDDSITLADPSSGNSLLSNGSVGLAYSAYTVWGSYSAPDKANLTSVIEYGTGGLTTKNLNAVYNLNLLIDDDIAATTVDLASKNKAYITGTTAFTDISSTTTSGFNPERRNISLNIDGQGAANIDLTQNAGINATHGYQVWQFTAATTAASITGLSNYGSAGFGNAVPADWTLLTGHGITSASASHEFSIAVETIVGGAATAVVFPVTTGETITDLIADMKGTAVTGLDAINGGALAGKYSLTISNGNLVFTLTDPSLAGCNVAITGTAGVGINLFVPAGIFNGLTPEQYEAHYTVQQNIDGAGAATINIDGADGDLTAVSSLITVLDAKLALLGSSGGCNFIAAGITDTTTGASGGTYGAMVVYSDTRGTEPSPGVTPSSVALADVVDVPGTSLSLRDELTNAKVTFETAVNGLDQVLTQAAIVSAIDTALTGTGLGTGKASFNSSNYLVVTSNKEGRTGTASSVVFAVGSAQNAATFFAAAPPITGLIGSATTLTQMVSAINTAMNTARSTTDIIYASKYVEPTDGQYQLKIQSEITGTDALLYINSTSGLAEAAPAADARATIWNGAGWATATETDIGSVQSANGMFKFVFTEEGTAANYVAAAGSGSSSGCYITFSTRANPIYAGYGDTTNQQYYRDITVYLNGLKVEEFKDVSYDVIATANTTTGALGWFVDAINTSTDNGGSEYISVEWYQADPDGTLDEDIAWSPSDPTTGTYLIPDGTLYLLNGIDGIPTGSIDSLVQAGIVTFANPELYNPHIIATPGVSSSSVINAVKNFIEGSTRQDILYLVDPPFGLEPDEIADWHNGKLSGSGYPTSAINSSYLALYWSWLKTYDLDNGEYIWCPPSVFMLAKLTEIDNNYKPWAIPAGTTRGKITADDYEYSPSITERDLLYDINDSLNVNPFVNFPGTGLIIYGQKTLLRENSALNRVAVRRTVIYIKKLMRITLKQFMFESNTPSTWARVTTSISNILEPIKQGAGLTAYAVTFDETTTTASLQDQHILAGIVTITPPSSIEAIEVTFAITAQGVELG